jgi:H+/Cl- antiporter ClcA
MIIFEMTGHHQMVLPLMLSALMGFLIARMVGAQHFYKTLSLQYAPLIEAPPPPPASQ